MVSMNKKQKGFTLIEILVVIAIIGILATIVLTSLGTARQKASDAKVQAQLSSMRSQAELFFGDNGNYGTPETDTTNGCAPAPDVGSLFRYASSSDGLSELIAAIPSTYTVLCYTDPTTDTATAWAVTAANGLSGGSAASWCVDSTGQSKAYNTSSPTPPVAAVCQ